MSLKKEGLVVTSPFCVNFTQESIAKQARSGQKVDDMIASMKEGGFRADGAIDVVKFPNERGNFQKASIDNRRLYAAQKAGLNDIIVREHRSGEYLPQD